MLWETYLMEKSCFQWEYQNDIIRNKWTQWASSCILLHIHNALVNSTITNMFIAFASVGLIYVILTFYSSKIGTLFQHFSHPAANNSHHSWSILINSPITSESIYLIWAHIISKKTDFPENNLQILADVTICLDLFTQTSLFPSIISGFLCDCSAVTWKIKSG